MEQQPFGGYNPPQPIPRNDCKLIHDSQQHLPSTSPTSPTTPRLPPPFLATLPTEHHIHHTMYALPENPDPANSHPDGHFHPRPSPPQTQQVPTSTTNSTFSYAQAERMSYIGSAISANNPNLSRGYHQSYRHPQSSGRPGPGGIATLPPRNARNSTSSSSSGSGWDTASTPRTSIGSLPSGVNSNGVSNRMSYERPTSNTIYQNQTYPTRYQLYDLPSPTSTAASGTSHPPNYQPRPYQDGPIIQPTHILYNTPHPAQQTQFRPALSSSAPGHYSPPDFPPYSNYHDAATHPYQQQERQQVHQYHQQSIHPTDPYYLSQQQPYQLPAISADNDETWESDFIPRSRPKSLLQVVPPTSPNINTFSDTGSISSLREIDEEDGAGSDIANPLTPISSVSEISMFPDLPQTHHSSPLDESPVSPTDINPRIVVESFRIDTDLDTDFRADRLRERSPSVSDYANSSDGVRSRTPSPVPFEGDFDNGIIGNLTLKRDSQSSTQSLPHASAPSPTSPSSSHPFRQSADATLIRSRHGSYEPQSPLLSSHQGQLQATMSSKQRTPIVYPALLSLVAEVFRQRINTGLRTKDTLEYKDAFDGRDAVDKIAYIIKTTDRNLALLLGRALDAQKFFHDVNYEHRLRDSPHELYQFRERIISPLIPELPVGQTTPNDDDESVLETSAFNAGYFVPAEDDLPNGVFTLLTDCYSPTCTRDKLCYSITCPRRWEQQARLNITPTAGLKRSLSRSSLHEKDQRLWVRSVPKEIADSVSPEERKRQENIFELIYTEKDFVNDLEYVRDLWMEPLTSGHYIQEENRANFMAVVFSNVLEIHAVNSRLSEALQKRQNAYAIVDSIGDLMLEHVVNFQPFVHYGSHQMIGKYTFETERAGNPIFYQFVEDTERRSESRKLELNGYLTKPTTRLGRYNLLLREILKHTPEGHPDRATIPRAMEIVRGFLTEVNVETGRIENQFTLEQIDGRLSFKAGTEVVDLKLREPGRQLILKGPLKKRGSDRGESSDVQLFLFDHYLILTKIKFVNGNEQYKINRNPIPLELLHVSLPEQQVAAKRASSILPYSRAGANMNLKPVTNNAAVAIADVPATARGGFPLIFTHLGRKGGPSFTLYAPTFAGRRQWMEKIEKQRILLSEKNRIFELMPLSERHFTLHNKVNCSTTFDFGKKIVLGTDLGVYVGTLHEPATLTKVLPLEKVQQIEILEDMRFLMILADRTLHTYSLDVLVASDPGNKRGRKYPSHVSFFKTGLCLDKTLVCIVKSNSISSTIRTLEPVVQADSKKNKSSLAKFLRSNSDVLKVHRDLYIPTELTSIHFLRTNLCVGCIKGFEIVDLTSLNTQELLDPEDEALTFVLKRENVRPISMCRAQNGHGEFLLCYDEFAFYVDRKGKRTRGDWMVNWEGTPNAFAFYYPYIVAFEPSFIEIRHMITGALEQLIPGNNIRCLNSNTGMSGAIQGVMDDRVVPDFQSVFELVPVNPTASTNFAYNSNRKDSVSTTSSMLLS